ncbi:uncharacterized protein FIBRA_06113 [Fibroporia radiculosa]|uniref:Senescence domain-containing protein n=1 Tax=Fibroporia radiculosa TaxID=599839 RepID=J4GAP1_9APHY|nr:uncharacterized protein FIBRA_06113 [Fibroporia radiculosa]CCM03958.1 predicted protein [Fibroporia radiculosa]
MKFEQILIHHGLLKEGVEAAADEVGKSVREDTADLAQNFIKDISFVIEDSPTTSPTNIPDSLQSAANSTASGTATLASAARRMSDAVGSVAGQAGAWVAGHITASSSPSETLISLSNASDIATGEFSTGAAEVRSAVSDTAGLRIEYAHGEQAREVLENMGECVQNVGAAAGNVAVATSGVGIAAAGIKGDAQSDGRQGISTAKDEDGNV